MALLTRKFHRDPTRPHRLLDISGPISILSEIAHERGIPMQSGFETKLDRYAELIINVAVNLQPGQRLIIGVPEYNTGAPLETAPLVRRIVERAYKKGASLVDVIWGDDALLLSRFNHASPDTFDVIPAWHRQALLETAESGGAFLAIDGNDPDLFKDFDPELVSKHRKAVLQNLEPAKDFVVRNAINWCEVPASTKPWAAKVFPDLPAEQQVPALWELIFKMCRVNEDDPARAWEVHRNQLNARSTFLNARRYASLHLTGPGTDLTIGLPACHLWGSSCMTRQDGLPFIANFPTEEVFTLPHKTRVDGYVQSSKPLSYGGALMEDFTLTFENGRVVNIQAKSGKSVLQKLIAIDEGSSHLGEIALVPHSSTVAQMDQLFYSILVDENAASHCALGSSYKFSVEGGREMTDEEFLTVGGNPSIVHCDFMIGSAHMHVDGITADNVSEPVMRAGEWAFDV